MKNNNRQVTLMALACVSVIAVTAMVLTAMMNVAHGQSATIYGNGTRTTVTQVGTTYYVNTSSVASAEARERAWEAYRARTNKEVARARRRANRTGDSVLVRYGVYVHPDTCLLNREPLTPQQVDLRLQTSQQVRNGLYGVLIASAAYNMNNNGNDVDAQKLFAGTLLVAVLDNVVTIRKRRKNANL